MREIIFRGKKDNGEWVYKMITKLAIYVLTLPIKLLVFVVMILVSPVVVTVGWRMDVRPFSIEATWDDYFVDYVKNAASIFKWE